MCESELEGRESWWTSSRHGSKYRAGIRTSMGRLMLRARHSQRDGEGVRGNDHEVSPY